MASFSCLCGKSYTFKSGLSRHQHGNVKEGIAPCSAYIRGVVESESADKSRVEYLAGLLETLSSNQKDPIISYSLSDVIPTHIDLPGSINHQKDLVRMPALWLERLHMNKSLPHFCNVKYSKSKTLRIKESGQWIQVNFESWVQEFIYRVIRVINILHYPTEEEKMFVIQVLNENRKLVVHLVQEQLLRSVEP